MKNGLFKILIPFLVVTMAFSMVSCKKEKDSSSISYQLQQSWNVTSIKTNYHSALGDSINVYKGAQNDTFHFRTDNSFISIIGGDTTTSKYSIISNTRIQIDNEYYSIMNFTRNSLVLYAKEGIPDSYFEITVTLRK